MKKLIPLRKIIMIIGIVLTLTASVLFLIFGKPEEKLSTTIATIIVIPLCFLFIKFMFYIVGKNGTNKVLAIYSWFFMIFGIIAILMGIINFFNPFASNSVPFISVGFTLVTSILFDHAKLKKNSDT